MMNSISMTSPSVAFGKRVKVDAEKGDALLKTVAVPALGVASVSSVGSAAVGSASATAGSVLQSGGSGLMTTGPQSASAGWVLDAMAKLGSAGAAEWSVANPVLGGAAQIVAGSVIGGGGGSSARSSSSQAPS